MEVLKKANEVFEPNFGAILIIAEVVSDKTKSGVIKGDKAIAEEKKKAVSDFVEVVAVSKESRFHIGQKVFISPDAQHSVIPMKFKETGDTIYHLVDEGFISGWLKKND